MIGHKFTLRYSPSIPFQLDQPPPARDTTPSHPAAKPMTMGSDATLHWRGSRLQQKEPAVPDPQDLSATLDALSALARSPKYTQVIRFLVDSPDSYYGQIQEHTAIPTSSLGRHLADLEARGIVVGDIPTSERRGRAVRYRVDLDYVEALLARLRTELLG